MTSLTVTNGDAILKQLYKVDKVADVTYQNRPAYATIRKFEGFGGRNMPIPLKYGNPMGRSQTFATAQASRTQTLYKAFLLTRVQDYSVATITSEMALSTRGDNMAFLDALTAQIDGAMAALADAHETFLFRNGTGSIGQVAVGGISSASLTLKSIHDVVNFEVGMTVTESSADGGSLGTGGSTGEVVAAINRATGVLTSTSVAWTTVLSGITDSHYLYVLGDAQAGGSALTKMAGFPAWVPASAPSSTSFFGIDRTSDVIRLGGNRYDGSSLTVEEALIDGQSVAAREGARIDTAFLNHVQVRTLKKELGSRIEYQFLPANGSNGAVANISFRALVVEGDQGPIKVVAANKCPAATGFLLQMDTWSLNSIGPATQFLSLDGNRILRQYNADGYEVRIGFYGNVGCESPGYNLNLTLTVPS